MFKSQKPVHYKPSFYSGIDRSHPLARNLWGCWLLNEGHGNTVHNIANTTNHGTIPTTLVTWVGGKRGSRLDFRDNNASINCGIVPIEFTQLSWEVYAKADDTGNFRGPFGCIDNADQGFGWFYASGSVRVQIWGAIEKVESSFSGHTDTLWHHWVTTYDGGTTLRMYKDMRLVHTNTAFAPGPVTSANNLMIGEYSGDANGEWQGGIGFVRLWKNRVITDSEVRQLYSDPYAMVLPPPHQRYFYSVPQGEAPPAGAGGEDWPKFQSRGFWSWQFS